MRWVNADEDKLPRDEMQKIADQLLAEDKKNSDRPCQDCGVEPGQPHSPGCDTARCLVCGGQRLTCCCEGGDGDVWDGMWPGTKTCHEELLICRWDGPTDRGLPAGEWQFDMNVLAIERLRPSVKEKRIADRKERWGE